ncbi:hypothetical protein DH2020_042637 [Rehmannia glutinosa]|uniref:MBD domain-containing protein n=1 Tax=Rehmannia glutinosa TaxID=99300 RepID=A0ABR0ULX6_REHGL
MYHLLPHRNEDKSIVMVKKLSAQQQHNLVPLNEIINSNIQPKYNLSLQERLEGWVVQKRKRNSSNTCDKYYIHDKVSTKFRSLKEVALFILYSCRKEDIVFAKVNSKISQQIQIVMMIVYMLLNSTGPPLAHGSEEPNEMNDEEIEIFSCALNNPITRL